MVEQQVPKDAPVMKAWEAYKTSEEYANSRKWAQTEEHVDGSMWAAFFAGFFACAVDEAQRMGDLRATNERLLGVLEAWNSAVRVDVLMEGPRYMGVSGSAGARAWELTRAALAEEKQ